MVRFASLYEAFETRRFEKGQVIFKNHQFTDKHIQETIDIIAKQLNLNPADIVKKIEAQIAQFEEARKLAPILYETIAQNIIENEVYGLYDKLGHEVTTAPKFNKNIFTKVVSFIKQDVKGLFPLRPWTGGKSLWNPVIVFDTTPLGQAKSKAKAKVPKGEEGKMSVQAGVTTAAASPKGIFYFNIEFMQNLINFAHIKGVKPKGKKYVSNGGDIPDEYAYIEFLILHEFLHYTQGDFYYQKIIPKADPKIINWVGDFRSNYMLVKSGYEQLPMGLFNDEINHDRQRTYKEMYDLVKSELEKLKKASEDQQRGKDQQGEQGQGEPSDDKGESIYDKVKKQLDDNADEHDLGQEEGEGEEIQGEPTEEELDKHQERIQKAMEEAEDLDTEEAEKRAKESQQKSQSNRGGRGSRTPSSRQPNQIDYSKVRPTFNWKDLLKKFIFSVKEEQEETYQKIASKSITGIHTATQLGKGAISPGEMQLDQKDIKLAFVIDSSGSMGNTIAKVYANIYNLLKTNKSLANTLFTLVKFSSNFEIYKCIFSTDKAEKVENIKETPKKLTLKTSNVFKEFEGNVTNFDSHLTSELTKLISDGYNIIVISDNDLADGENMIELTKLIKSHKDNIFTIFDDRDAYIQFRQNSKMSNANISYIE